MRGLLIHPSTSSVCVWKREKEHKMNMWGARSSVSISILALPSNETLLHAVVLQNLCDALYQCNEYLWTICCYGCSYLRKPMICAPYLEYFIWLFSHLAIWSASVNVLDTHKLQDIFVFFKILRKYDRAIWLYSLNYSCVCVYATWNDVSAYLSRP